MSELDDVNEQIERLRERRAVLVARENNRPDEKNGASLYTLSADIDAIIDNLEDSESRVRSHTGILLKHLFNGTVLLNWRTIKDYLREYGRTDAQASDAWRFHLVVKR
jgi:hypothetical protein